MNYNEEENGKKMNRDEWKYEKTRDNKEMKYNNLIEKKTDE